MGPAGMVSFGHAAYFGLGAYAAGLLLKRGGLPMEAALVLAPLVAGAFAVVYGWFCVRLSGVYLAMLTLAFAQISWSIVFQWDSLHRRQQRPLRRLAVGLARRQDRLLLSGARLLRRRHRAAVARAVLALRLRPARRPRFAAARRGDRHRPARLSMGGLRAGRRAWRAWPARVYAFSKGSISPSTHLHRPVDRRADHGAAGRRRDPDRAGRRAPPIFTWLRDEVARRTEFWRAVMGGVILADRAALPAGPGRRPQGARRSAGARRAHERGAAGRRPAQVVRRRAGGGRRLLRRRRRRAAGPDRPQRRGQEHLLQHAERPARARRRHRAPRAAATSSA